MEQIPDAPWIRQAETEGYPPDLAPEREFPASSIADDMSSADYKIGHALEFMYRAVDQCQDTPYEEELTGLIMRLEDWREDMQAEMRRVEKRSRL